MKHILAPIGYHPVVLLLSIYTYIYLQIFQSIHDQSALKPPPCKAQIESVTPTATQNLQLLKCKAFISQSQAQQYAYPVERDLVVVDFQEPYLQMGSIEIFQYRFAVVESVNRMFIHSATDTNLRQVSGTNKDTNTSLNTSSNTGAELTLTLKIFGLEAVSMFSLENHTVELKVVTSLTTALRQWNGLINLHTSQLVRDILYPRGGAYFGLTNRQQGAREHALKLVRKRHLYAGTVGSHSSKQVGTGGSSCTQAGKKVPLKCTTGSHSEWLPGVQLRHFSTTCAVHIEGL